MGGVMDRREPTPGVILDHAAQSGLTHAPGESVSRHPAAVRRDYYVIAVKTGGEQRYIKSAENLMTCRDGRFIWPRRALSIRKGGVTSESIAPLYPELRSVPDDPARRHRQLIELGIAVLLGMLAATVAKVLGGSSNKVIAVVMFGVLAAPVVLWVRDPQLLASLTVAGLAFTVPLNLDFNLFYRPHVGGAPSITVNLTLLMLIALASTAS